MSFLRFNILFLSVISFAYSQTNNAVDSSSTSPLSDGSWAIQFKITENLTLSSFNGVNISLKRHFSANSAVRLSVTLYGNSDKSEDELNDSVEQYPDTDTFANGEGKNFYLNVNPQYLFYLHPQNNPSIYFGLGPFFDYRYIDKNDTRLQYSADTLYSTETYTTDLKEYSIGITAIVGIEIFINDYLSFHSEYSSSGYYGYRDQITISKRDYSRIEQNDRINTRKSSQDGFYFNGNKVLFGLSVYF